jgi:uncharacterized protein
MKLDIIQSPPDTKPWFADGLQFTCSQCGNCCSGPPGYVWITEEEIAKLAQFLKISRKKLLEKYCRKIGSQFSLKESRHPQHGGYDCVFVKEIPAERSDASQQVTHARRICSIYSVRPLQCRTWPFWEGNLASPKAWALAAKKCHGMNRGKTFDRKKIEQLRDAKEWLKNPPTS